MLFEDVPVPANDAEWESLIAAWIEYEESNEQRSDDDSRRWASEAVDTWRYDENHEVLWKFITATFERKMSDRAFSILAAGALEDLLAGFGDTYIQRVEELARKNPRFNSLLGGVWKNSMTDDVWNRVEKARYKVW